MADGNFDFDPDVLALLKKETDSEPEQGMGMDEEGDEIEVAAFIADIPHDRAEKILASIRSQLKPGYLAFIWEMNFGTGGESDKLGVIKSADQFDLLRMKQTNGDNYDVSNEDIIEKLKKWEAEYSIEIIGADFDWVDFTFKTVPDDVKKLAREVYKFCPDSVEQGVGTVKALENEIKTKKRLFLWWD